MFHDIIDNLPNNLKRNVLYSLVGSGNASLIGSAQSIAHRLEQDGYDLKELEVADFEALLAGPDENTQRLHGLRVLNAVVRDLRDDLVAVTADDKAGSISETISFMITNPRGIDSKLIAATLEAAGIEGVAPELIKAKFGEQQAARAARLAAQQGSVEYIIDHVFEPVDATPHTLDELADEVKSRFHEKLLAALVKTRDNAVIGVIQRSSFYSFSDLPILTAAIKQAEALLQGATPAVAANDEPPPAAPKAKGKFRRVKKEELKQAVTA